MIYQAILDRELAGNGNRPIDRALASAVDSIEAESARSYRGSAKCCVSTVANLLSTVIDRE